MKESIEQELISATFEELKKPTFYPTKQYLEVLDLTIVRGKPKVERVDFHSYEETNVVYVSVKEESFFLAFYFLKENNELNMVSTESGNQVYFTATSEILSFQQLSEITKLTGSVGWSVNDKRNDTDLQYKFSRISFEPVKSLAYNVESRLNLLLDELESDVEGVSELVSNFNGFISVRREQYISGNKGIHLDQLTIKRLNNLNLSVDIAQYVSGKELMD
jgi:hypothetical protein